MNGVPFGSGGLLPDCHLLTTARRYRGSMNRLATLLVVFAAFAGCATGVSDSVDSAVSPPSEVTVDAAPFPDARPPAVADAAPTETEDASTPPLDSSAPLLDSAVATEDASLPVDSGARFEAAAPDAAQTQQDSGNTSCGPGLAPPATVAACTACQTGTHTCQANGCYNGYWCNTSTNHCGAAPPGCA